jgi:hypothetical protein
MLWALAPQLACFMPDQMTETEQQCCKQMANDCGGSGISHECCRTVVRPDVGTLAALNRGIAPDCSVVGTTHETFASAWSYGSNTHSLSSNHAPPHDSGGSPVILRI